MERTRNEESLSAPFRFQHSKYYAKKFFQKLVDKSTSVCYTKYAERNGRQNPPPRILPQGQGCPQSETSIVRKAPFRLERLPLQTLIHLHYPPTATTSAMGGLFFCFSQSKRTNQMVCPSFLSFTSYKALTDYSAESSPSSSTDLRMLTCRSSISSPAGITAR